ELSDKYSNFFTPSNQTFAIWSLIYLLLTAVLISQFTKKFNHPILNTPLFLFSCILNFSWILFWQSELIGISLVVMIGLLSCLGVINYKLQDQKQWLLNVSFGIYLGWICIATIANVTTFLQSIEMNLNIEIQKIVSIIIIATGTVIITWVMKKTKNPFLSIAAAWAFYGIYSKQIENYPSIAYMALLCQAFIIVAGAQLIYSIFKNQ
ncbi:MAG: tryptophan-rich sensory protein, partial [Oxalobacteraceae bacterium]|nr:tryptophan-rich sensory protein [Oxalobacteraceae bacterium]